MENVYQVSFS